MKHYSPVFLFPPLLLFWISFVLLLSNETPCWGSRLVVGMRRELLCWNFDMFCERAEITTKQNKVNWTVAMMPLKNTQNRLCPLATTSKTSKRPIRTRFLNPSATHLKLWWIQCSLGRLHVLTSTLCWLISVVAIGNIWFPNKVKIWVLPHKEDKSCLKLRITLAILTLLSQT